MYSIKSFFHVLFPAILILMLFNRLTEASPLDGRQLNSDHLPTHGGGSELPSPSAGYQLKAVGLGRGTQNYTCASPIATPVSDGALAILYDISILPEAVYNPLTNFAVNLSLGSLPYLNFDLLGHHYYTASGIPTFDLGPNGFFSGVKQSDIPAPAGAAAGPDGTGAVDWLELDNKGNSTGIFEVYRVETAGGKAPATCSGHDARLQIQYAAEYWFYG